MTVTKTPLNLSGLSGRSGCHVEQKVPRVEQKFHLSHFVETKYHVTTNNTAPDVLASSSHLSRARPPPSHTRPLRARFRSSIGDYLAFSKCEAYSFLPSCRCLAHSRIQEPLSREISGKCARRPWPSLARSRLSSQVRKRKTSAACALILLTTTGPNNTRPLMKMTDQRTLAPATR